MSLKKNCGIQLIVCDRCGRGDSVEGDNPIDWYEYAEDFGWRIGPDAEGDWCPHCLHEVRVSRKQDVLDRIEARRRLSQ